MPTKRLISATVVAAAASLGVVSNAGAATYCANVPAPCDGAQGTYIASLQAALDAAAAQDGHDKIVLGDKEYVTVGGFTYDTADQDRTVEIVGQGPKTVLKADAEAKDGFTVLKLAADGSEVRNLQVLVPNSSGVNPTTGLMLDRQAKASKVVVHDDRSTGGADTGVELGEGTLADSAVGMNDGTATRGVNVTGAVSLVTRTSVEATTALRAEGDGVLVAGRNRLAGRRGVVTYGANATVFDTAIDTDTSAGVALAAVSSPSDDALIKASHVSQFGRTADTTAVLASTSNAHPANVELQNSVFAGQGASLTTVANGAAQANIHANRNAYDGAVSDDAGPGAITEIGTITADPKLVDPANGDVRLAAGSPLIDAGVTPELVTNAIDLYGNTRPIDGNADGVAQVDVGAAERIKQVVLIPPKVDPDPKPNGGGQTPNGGGQTPSGGGQTPNGGGLTPDTVAPVVKKVRFVAKRKRLRFSLSEAARVTIKVQRKKGKRFRTVATLRRTLKAGTRSVKLRGLKAKRRHRVVISAVDAASNRSSTKRVAFRVKARR